MNATTQKKIWTREKMSQCQTQTQTTLMILVLLLGSSLPSAQGYLRLPRPKTSPGALSTSHFPCSAPGWADAMVEASSSTSLFDQSPRGGIDGPGTEKGGPDMLSAEEEAYYQKMIAEGTDNSIIKDAEDSIWASVIDGLVKPSSEGDQHPCREMTSQMEYMSVRNWLAEYLPRTAPLIRKLELKMAGSNVAERAVWYADRLPRPEAVIVLDPKQGREPGFLELAGFTLSPAIMAALVSATLPPSCTSLQIAHLDSFYEGDLFAALERRGFAFDWKESCSLWHLPPDAEVSQPSLPLDQDIVLKQLEQEDAELVNSFWTYKSNHSLEMIQGIIKEKTSSGLWLNGTLVSWMCTYHDGAVGMLYTKETYRRQGFAKLVLCHLINQHQSKTIPETAVPSPIFCFIVDSNTASCTLFQQTGFNRICDASWVKFKYKQCQKRKLSSA